MKRSGRPERSYRIPPRCTRSRCLRAYPRRGTRQLGYQVEVSGRDSSVQLFCMVSNPEREGPDHGLPEDFHVFVGLQLVRWVFLFVFVQQFLRLLAQPSDFVGNHALANAAVRLPDRGSHREMGSERLRAAAAKGPHSRGGAPTEATFRPFLRGRRRFVRRCRNPADWLRGPAGRRAWCPRGVAPGRSAF